MTIAKKIKEMLEQKSITYQVLEHQPAFTALETAQAQHIPGRQVVKSVIVEADGKMMMCILPATHHIDFSRLKQVLRVKEVHLATEKQLAALFPGYEIGAEPPFGQEAHLDIYADKMLEENDSIVFNAGTHTEVIRMKFKDYIALVQPTFADFGVHIHPNH